MRISDWSSDVCSSDLIVISFNRIIFTNWTLFQSYSSSSFRII
ncbi:hypothetical protein CMALT394_1250001 [Carnobacterium maltaromaticum]|nr:hypothetical protein CMALT394_1250001 [Carnobacterium maltaromaticum]